MAGGGENERQEAVHAAAQLGVSGSVEVTKSGGRHGGEVEQYTEVGVQTEPLRMPGHEKRRVTWRREVRDGLTYLWKETTSDIVRDVWTQTEEQLVNSDPPAPPVLPYETIDISTLQSLMQTDSHQLVPLTLIYPPDENQALQCSSSSSSHLLQESTTAVVAPQYLPAPTPTQTASREADSQSCWADPNEWEGERLEQFQGNITGYIDHFLNPEKRENGRGGRAARKPRGARAAGGGQRRTRRPRGRRGARGRGGFTQTVDAQEIVASKLQREFLHRWRVSTPRTGQGGGAVGRKLYLKTREELEPAGKVTRRKARGKVLEEGQGQDMNRGSDGAAADGQRGQRNAWRQFSKANVSVGTDEKCRDQPAPGCSSLPSNDLHCGPGLPPPSPRLGPMHSPIAPYVPPAPTPRPPGPPPPQEHQFEQMDNFLEEVMMGLDVFPSNTAATPRCALPTGSGTFSSSDNAAVQSDQEARISSSAVPALQQECEGDLNDILENFLLSFERHFESSVRRIESETPDEGGHEETGPWKHRTAQVHEQILQTPHLQPEVSGNEAPGVRREDVEPSENRLSPKEALPAENSEDTREKTAAPTRRPKNRRRRKDRLSLEKRTVKETGSLQHPKATSAQDLKEQQLQLIPVVKLDRRHCLLPVPATLQGLNDRSPEEESSPEKRTSSAKRSRRRCFGTNSVIKSYPIRSRLKGPQSKESLPFLEQNVVRQADRQRGCWPDRPRKNGNLLSSPVAERTAAQQQSLSSCCTMTGQTEENPTAQEEDLTVESEEEVGGPAGRGLKRGAESMKGADDEVLEDKRMFLSQTSSGETFPPRSQAADVPAAASAAEQDDAVIDVETVSLSSSTDCLQEAKPGEESISDADKTFSGEDTEIIDVEGDEDDC
ncbi:uncharacterized protein LOC105932632 [Fundulus heteroclitus]|uniref:uncharacterized protein LOC105932632 n=1 Tax=Fundulus heteroclitus TaxID=8078 RepID=UPI00165C0DF0|nr:uncharacterized protein LOC105932632 [Fundulus heteroclitus]XP_035983206.1 uncharacterized protein LOC105932632 [Fundulus heteroclitus]